MGQVWRNIACYAMSLACYVIGWLAKRPGMYKRAEGWDNAMSALGYSPEHSREALDNARAMLREVSERSILVHHYGVPEWLSGLYLAIVDIQVLGWWTLKPKWVQRWEMRRGARRTRVAASHELPEWRG